MTVSHTQFAKHVALIREQEPHVQSPNFLAHMEGEAGFSLRSRAAQFGLTVSEMRAVDQIKFG